MKKLTKSILSVGVLSLIVEKAHAQNVVSLNGSNLRRLFLQPFQGDFLNFVGGIITWVISIAGIIAFVFLIMGGFEYLTAGGDSDKASKGRTTITNAIIGLIIIAIAFALARFVVGNVNNTAGTNPGNVTNSSY